MSLFFTSLSKWVDAPLTHDRRLADIFLSYVPFHPLALPINRQVKPIKLPKPLKVSITSLLSLHSIIVPLTHFTPPHPSTSAKSHPQLRGYGIQEPKGPPLLTYHTKPITSKPSKPSHQFPQWLVGVRYRYCRPQRFNSVDGHSRGRAKADHSGCQSYTKVSGSNSVARAYRIISYYPVFRQDSASLKVERCIGSEIGPFNTPN
ncbi:hypothetical protein B9Z19DRAFT_258105 [Tuber borchii]|uniref:Uncharacterized protein n=1 Tax=Tuber borchii TaxID=42251 RepID=A0A2T6ZLK3_TUBBO|nr:hypothetical protein B9Z19DRAFT_258105 [Tuber borchii]